MKTYAIAVGGAVAEQEMRGFCKLLNEQMKLLGGARRRSNGRSKGGAAEQRRHVFEATRDFTAEQKRRRCGATAYIRGGLLRRLPAAPPLCEDSGISQASN